MSLKQGFLSSFCLLSLALAGPMAGAQVIKPWPKKSETVLVNDYLKFLDEHAKAVCPASVKEEISKLYKEYRSVGQYIPYLKDDSLDKEAIKKGIPFIEKKLRWIEALRSELKQSKSFPGIKDARELESKLADLLDLKRDHAAATNAKTKSQIKARSEKKMVEFQKAFDQFVAKIPFLQSFGYPVDHLKNRIAYEEAAEAGKVHEKNTLYFQRKIYEDGAIRTNGRLTDIYERSTLDTIKHRLLKAGSFLPDDIRYDLEWVLVRLDLYLKQGSTVMDERLASWEKQTQESLNFYQSLLAQDLERKPAQLSQSHALASKKLAEYIRKKQADIYARLAKESELTRALFSMDQILLNEVGRATNENYRERRDVAQVVINRHSHPSYSKLPASDPLQPFLKKLNLPQKQEDLSWLNLLFKEGEFSFTYYFIPAVEHSICPDFYKVAKDTRSKNAFLTLDLLKEPNSEFKGLRYYSRFSMVGKIDVASFWKAYKPMPEQVGRKIDTDRHLRAAAKAKKYRYFYDFKDATGAHYHVVEVKGEPYAVKGLFSSKPQFFNYRDPHQFRFFEPI